MKKLPKIKEIERKYKSERETGWFIFVILILTCIGLIILSNQVKNLNEENVELREQCSLGGSNIEEECSKLRFIYSDKGWVCSKVCNKTITYELCEVIE
jgi:hypothetical protein